jgi:hypothetical protein
LFIFIRNDAGPMPPKSPFIAIVISDDVGLPVPSIVMRMCRLALARHRGLEAVASRL